MVVTAVLGIRNEQAYLANCLRHLVRNGINFIILDNGSTDASAEIYRRREFAANLVAIRHLPYNGAFSLSEQLRAKSEIIAALDADWVIHLDADEVMQSYCAGELLSAAFCRVDAAGWNVINFDEFVFLPVEQDYLPEASGEQSVLHYYFFEPAAPRLMRAWKPGAGLSFTDQAGHSLDGAELRLAPERFALKHYIVRSQEHAFRKYTTRIFAADERARGWHQARDNQSIESFRLPTAEVLRRLPHPHHRNLDRSDPWKEHYWRRSFA